MRLTATTARHAGLCALALFASACNPVYYLGAKFVYRPAALPANQGIHDFSYAVVPGNVKQQLDWFMPTGRHWPVVVFVHGGSWTEGDRALTIGGADIYRNIGRFLAKNGIGAAVISYRLVPAVTWQEQAADVVQAVRWVYTTGRVYGAQRDAVFLAGHSAGAQLAARAALDRTSLESAGVPARAIRGMFLVSGAGYDMADQTTYDLGHRREFYANVFRGTSDDTTWERTASPLQFVSAVAPPSVVMHAGGDDEPLKRQSRLLHDALQAAGARSRLVEVPGLSHTRIVPTLSRGDRAAGAALVEFVQDETARTAE